MQTVWKYLLDDANAGKARKFGRSFVVAPKGTRFLDVEEQRNTAVLYALVNPNQKEMRTYYFMNVGTGVPIEEPVSDSDYVGSAVLTREDRQEPEEDNSVHHFFYMPDAEDVLAVPAKAPQESATVIDFAKWQPSKEIHAA